MCADNKRGSAVEKEVISPSLVRLLSGSTLFVGTHFYRDKNETEKL